jgi:hypothetical protein
MSSPDFEKRSRDPSHHSSKERGPHDLDVDFLAVVFQHVRLEKQPARVLHARVELLRERTEIVLSEDCTRSLVH